MESQRHMLTISVEGEPEPLGFIEINDQTTLSEARVLIENELEDFPKDFRFLVKNGLNNSFVKLSLIQEGKRRAADFLPTAVIKGVVQTNGIANAPSINASVFSSAFGQQSLILPDGDAYGDFVIGNTTLTPIQSSTIPPVSPKGNSHLPRSGANTPEQKMNGIVHSHAINNNGPLDIPQLWNSYFGGRTDPVPLDELPFALLSIAGITNVDTNSDNFKALLDLIINMGPNAYTKTDDTQFEDANDVFNRIFKSFGPLNGFLGRIIATIKLSYFHGNISAGTAEALVRGYPSGTFLLRLSNSHPGSFALTVRPKEGAVYHYIIERTPDFKFKLGKDVFDTLEELIECNKKRLRFLHPCPNSPFAKTFQPTSVATRSYQDFI